MYYIITDKSVVSDSLVLVRAGFLVLIMPRCACASEVYGSRFVSFCLSICLSVCLLPG